MKILHVIPSIAPRYGGPSAAVVGMASATLRHGDDVLIATTNADGPGTLPVRTEQSVRYEETPTIFFDRQFSEAFKYSRPLARWVDAHVTDFDAVHIHAVFSHASIAAGRACRAKGVPYIVRPLGTLDPWSLAQKRARKQLMWSVAGRSLVEGAAAIHYTTKEEQRLAERFVKTKRGVVIPLGIDLPVRHQRDTADPYVLSIGRLHPKKNLELLIDSFGAIVRERPELARWRLLIAGDGDPEYVRLLRRRATDVSPARIEFSGWVSGDRKQQVLQQAALVALLSHQENFGLAVLEALAHAVPALVSPDVNLADELSSAEAGWIVSDRREVVSSALAGILAADTERIRRGESGRRLAERFAWPLVAENLAGLYQSLTHN